MMMNSIRNWFRGSPTKEAYYGLLSDYETLVRLARRCAYDLRHTVDQIPVDHFYIKKMKMDDAAQYWVGLFAKGNPGKDYRLKLHSQITDLESKNEKLKQLCLDNGISISEVYKDDIPF